MCWPGLTEMDVTDSGTKLRLSECSAQTPKVVFLRALLNQKHTRILKKFKRLCSHESWYYCRAQRLYLHKEAPKICLIR